MTRLAALTLSLALGILAAGCAESAHQTGMARLGDQIPDSLRHLVDEQVSFVDVKSAPASYGGKTVMFGGSVIRATRKQDKTEVEVLQLPLGTDGIPVEDRSQSQGRFIIEQEAFLDPATLEAGTPITVIGTVEGDTTRPLGPGEDAYTYPVLRIVQILNWPTLPSTNSAGGWAYQYNPYAYYGPGYWGSSYYAAPYWYPWGYGYGGRGSWNSSPPSRSSGSSPSSSGAIPPQFGNSGSSSGGSSSGSSSFGSSSPSLPPQFQKRNRD